MHADASPSGEELREFGANLGLYNGPSTPPHVTVGGFRLARILYPKELNSVRGCHWVMHWLGSRAGRCRQCIM